VGLSGDGDGKRKREFRALKKNPKKMFAEAQ
jgi:hypothetical protein